MFQSARLKLTAWYLLIILFISSLFSFAIYSLINQEYKQIERKQLRRLEQQGLLPFTREIQKMRKNDTGNIPEVPPAFDLDVVPDARKRLISQLFILNGVIIGVAGVAGYFLAGRTLRPIKDMVLEQHRFITDASHELRTPLTSLKSEIEVNLRDKSLSLQDAKTVLKSNLEDVNNLQLLSDNLLQLARHDDIRTNKQVKPVILGTILDQSKNRVLGLANKKKITIMHTNPGNYVKGDSTQLIELFVILFDNAIKYSPKGTAISVTTKKSDHAIQIAVSDEGFGIDTNDIPHIFDRFYRADKSRTKETIPGYGLGLSIAKKIVTEHNGSIMVKSKTKGATFFIKLPEVKNIQ